MFHEFVPDAKSFNANSRYSGLFEQFKDGTAEAAHEDVFFYRDNFFERRCCFTQEDLVERFHKAAVDNSYLNTFTCQYSGGLERRIYCRTDRDYSGIFAFAQDLCFSYLDTFRCRVDRETPVPLPRGYRIEAGFPHVTAVLSICWSSFSSFGAITTIFGMERR